MRSTSSTTSRTMTDVMIILKKTLKTFALLLSIQAGQFVQAQPEGPPDADQIALVARPLGNSIDLRWMPLHTQAWQNANEHGYRVERFVISRRGKLLPK